MWINEKIPLTFFKSLKDYYQDVCVCVCVCVKLLQLCRTLCDDMNRSLPGSSVLGIP